MLGWATTNGAEAMGLSGELGSIEVGKNPGLNLLSPFDFNRMKPVDESRVKRLV